jgi:hypothetical protein
VTPVAGHRIISLSEPGFAQALDAKGLQYSVGSLSVHMANKKSLGPILVHGARGKLAVRRTGMNTFFSVVLGTGIALASVAGSSGFSQLEWSV